MRALAVFSPCDQDDSMHPKAAVRQAQQKALATAGTEVQSYESAVGLAVLDDEGLFRIYGMESTFSLITATLLTFLTLKRA